jgi:hypothetical protein
MSTTCRLNTESMRNTLLNNDDIIDLSRYIGQSISSVVTNLRIYEHNPVEYIDTKFSFTDDYDVISKMEFKKTSTRKVKLTKTEFKPRVILD